MAMVVDWILPRSSPMAATGVPPSLMLFWIAMLLERFFGWMLIFVFSSGTQFSTWCKQAGSHGDDPDPDQPPHPAQQHLVADVFCPFQPKLMAFRSKGKSYELVSFAAQQPDTTVFIPSGSEMKAVVRYPEPEELEKEKPGFGSRTPSSRRSAGSSRKTMSRFTSASKNRSSQASAFSLGEHSAEPSSKHKQKRRDKSNLGHSNVSGKSSQGSQARGTESNTSSDMPQASVEKSKKEKKKVRIAEKQQQRHQRDTSEKRC